jgi:cytidyltransferase-like protein
MKVVMICGTFDLLHHGHLHLFKHAKEYGDKLVAVIATDSNVRKYKGFDTYHSQKERAELLSSINHIDEVIVGSETDPYSVIKTVKPDFFVLGYDQELYVDELADAITSYGLQTRIVRVPPYKPEKYKSHKIRKYLEKFV